MSEQNFTYPIELDRLDSWQTCKNQDKSRKMKLVVQVHQAGESVRHLVFFGARKTVLTLLEETL